MKSSDVLGVFDSSHLREKWERVAKTHCGSKPIIRKVFASLQGTPEGGVACTEIVCPVCGKEQRQWFSNTLYADHIVKWNDEADDYWLFEVGELLQFPREYRGKYDPLYIHKRDTSKYSNKGYYELSSPKSDGTQRLRKDIPGKVGEWELIKRLYREPRW